MIVDLKEKGMDQLKKGDMFIFNGKQLEPISSEELLNHLHKELNGLKQELNTVKQGLSNHDKEFKRLFAKFDKFIAIFRIKGGNQND